MEQILNQLIRIYCSIIIDAFRINLSISIFVRGFRKKKKKNRRRAKTTATSMSPLDGSMGGTTAQMIEEVGGSCQPISCWHSVC